MENPTETLMQQNKLLEGQNKLLGQINDLLTRQKSPSNEIFVDNIDRDEMRNGFLVTSHRKKLWNVQIGLINEFARICKKHNLKWFACGGTLLGAARHRGFIPWDDDVDVAMMRPDYNKFLRIVEGELKYPYFLDICYNTRLESDETPDPIKTLPYLDRAHEAYYFRQRVFPSFPLTKIRDSRTTMIEFIDRNDMNQGIWIDVFPFDIMPPFAEDRHRTNFAVLREVMLATFRAEDVRKALSEDQKTLVDRDELKNLLKMPFRIRGAQFDNFAEKIFFESEKVGDIRLYGLTSGFAYDTNDFDEIIYLPFENIELPAPKNYDNVLKSQYGNWHEMKISHSHTSQWSADIPYTEYYRTSPYFR